MRKPVFNIGTGKGGKFGAAIILGAVVGLSGAVIALTPLGLGIEQNIGLDWLFKMRGPRPAPSDVVVISIDKESAHALNLPYEPVKWSRSLHAEVVDYLAAHGARAIGFDMFFKEQRNPEENKRLGESFMRAGNVVLFQYLDKQVLNRSGTGFSSSESITIEHLIPPVKEFAGTALASGPFSLPKVPAEVEQYWAFKSSAGGAPSLPALMFQLYTLPVYAEFRKLIGQVAPKLIQNLPADDAAILRDKNLSDVVADIRQLFSMHPNLAGKMFAQLAGSQITHADRKNDNYLAALIKMYAASDSRFLNFYGPARSIATISYHRVLEAARNNKKNVPAMDFNGKAVFIGLSEPIQLDQVDTFYTPYSLANGVDISGVEIMATAFANMVDGTEVQPLNAMDMIILLLAWGVIISIIGRLLPTGWAIAMTLTIAGSYLYISVHYFSAYNRWLPLVTPLLLQTPFALFGSLVWRYKETNRERKKIRNAFGFYLPDYVIDEISNDFDAGKTSRKLVFGTCLSSDAERYTSLAENMAPEVLADLMNRYYNELFEPISNHKGFVSDVVGDAMMAIWVTPKSELEHRRNSCQAALDILEAVGRFNKNANPTKLPIRMGVHSGEMLLGNIGALHHYEYRAVGDVINTASRIQGLNKHLGTRLLVSADTVKDLDDFLLRPVGSFVLVGKTKPTNLFELLCRRETASQSQVESCRVFSEALLLFQQRDWNSALRVFDRLKNEIMPTTLVRFYINLCATFLNNPPPEHWNGEIIMDKK